MCGLITHVIVQCNAHEPACISLGDGAQFRLYGNWLKANLRLHAPIASYVRECIFQGINMSSLILRIKTHADSSIHTQRLQHLQIQSDKSTKQSENISDAATNHLLPITLNESVTATTVIQIDNANIPQTDAI